MAEPPSSPLPLPPKESLVRRYKLMWRVLLISNLALGAYMFVTPKKKSSGELHGKTSEVGAKESKVVEKVEEVPSTPSESDIMAIYEAQTYSPPVVKVREPIPEDQQRELFNWVLEEKRKVKPKDREEKKRIDEEKAILKQFIRADSTPSL
ncbi:hypothetical protein UlMin_022083 [Ulmus minor]